MAFAPPAHGRGTQQKQDDPEQRVDEREPRPAGEAASFRLALGDGAPVDPDVRGRAEAAWGTSLADVRVHTDAAGEAAASAAGAQAATVGGDVAFAPGRYRPGTLRGDALIAHELAHVVQQRGAGSTAAPDASHEADATRAAVSVVAPGVGEPYRPGLRGGLALQRCGFLEGIFTDTETHGHEVLAPAPAPVRFPGESPGVVQDFQRSRDGWQEVRFDSDGDQFTDSVVAMRTVDSDQYGRPRTISIGLARQDTPATRVTANFTLSGRGEHLLIPRISDASDGREPTRIELQGSGGPVATISPPRRTAAGDEYTVTVESASQTLVLPALPPARTVFAPDAPPSTGGGVDWIDATVGAYGDRFRFTVQADASRPDGAIFGVSVLIGRGDSARAYWGDSVPITVANRTRPRIVATSGIVLDLDLNGDGRADLTVTDRLRYLPDYTLTLQPPPDPAARREHLLDVSGPAMVGAHRFDFQIAGGQVHAGYSSEATFPAASAAAAATYFGREAAAGTAADDVARLEQTLLPERQRAFDDRLIGRTLFDAWSQAETDLIQIRVGLESPSHRVDPGVQTRAVTDVGAFYDALAAETVHEFESRTTTTVVGDQPASVTIDVNPYTHEGRVPGVVSVPLRTGRDELLAAVRDGRWQVALERYRELLAGMDRWIAHKREAADPDLARRIRYMTTLSTQLTGLAQHSPRRIVAVFHPMAESVAAGAPVDVPMPLYYWDEGGQWHLVSLLDPERPFTPDPVPKGAAETEPPETLFHGLDNRYRLPPGMIHYQIPGGRGGVVPVTSSWTWADTATAIGLGLAAVGLVLATAGTGTVAVVGAYCLAGSAVIGAGVAARDLYERARADALDETAVTLDLLQIVAGIAGATTIVSGRILVSAVAAANEGRAWTGLAARVAQGADFVYVPSMVTAATADVLQVPVMTSQTLAQLEQIQQNHTMTPEQQRRAMVLLLANAVAMTGMVVLSVRGTLPELNRGSSIRIVFAEVQAAEPVARPRGGGTGTAPPVEPPPAQARRVAVALPATTAAGEAMLAARPRLQPGQTAAEFEAATADYLRTLRSRFPGAAGDQLAEIEEQALRMGWRIEETRRITNDVLERASGAAQPVRRQLNTSAGRIAEILNDPALDVATRRARVLSELDAMERAAAGDPHFRGFDWSPSRAAAGAVSDTASAGVYVRDAAGNLFRNGRPAGRVQDLLDRVAAVNASNFAQGIDVEYLVVLRDPAAGATQSEVQIVSRTRQTLVPPAGIPSERLPSLRTGATGRYVVDVGAGGAAYASDMTPQSDRAAGTLVQTEMPDFASAMQVRRSLGIENVAPRADPRSVTVLGDALKNLELFFGTPAQGRGVRRIFINNINAHYTAADYDQVARQLQRVMGSGGQIEVQWDVSPELPTAPAGDLRRLPGSRGHITGDELYAALRRAGSTVAADPPPGRTGPGIEYPYTIRPSFASGGSRVAPEQRPPSPNPADPQTGRRMVLTFP